MPNPLKHIQEIEGFSDASQVVRTVVVVMDAQTYRIDVLKGYAETTAPYAARCSVHRYVTMHPTRQLCRAEVRPRTRA
jgi:hypothetical protein